MHHVTSRNGPEYHLSYPTDLLSQRLKEGTKDSHVQAERSPLIMKLFRGLITKQEYSKLLQCFYHIYRALEEAKDSAIVDSMRFDALNRVSSISNDLEFFSGAMDGGEMPANVAVQEYVDRIRYTAEQAPYLYVAHAYTRYLGDLSGGQILRKKIKKRFELEDDVGVAFYVFKDIRDVARFKDEYRQRMDALPLTLEQKIAVVEEANLSFSMNRRVFDSIQ